MAELLPRYEQILTILRDAKGGITNREIIERAQKMRNNQIPNDINQMSLNAQPLRRRELIRTVEAPGGKLQFITTKGLDALAESLGEQPKSMCKNESLPPSPESLPPSSESLPPSPDDNNQISIIDAFDDAVATIRQAMQIALLMEQPKSISITDKARKLATLEQLEKFPAFTQDIADMLSAIRADIEKIEEA